MEEKSKKPEGVSWGDHRPLKKLGPQHELLIELAAAGHRTGEIAEKLGMTVSHISTLLSNSEIKVLIRKRREQLFDGKFEERLNQLMPRILSLADHIMYGPYEALPELGSYVAFFRLKIGSDSHPGPIAYLDVCGGAQAGRELYRSSFPITPAYKTFALPFRVMSLDDMEYRVLPHRGSGSIWVDFVAVCKEEDLAPTAG